MSLNAWRNGRTWVAAIAALGICVIAAHGFGSWPFRREVTIITIPSDKSDEAVRLFTRDGYDVAAVAPIAADDFGDHVQLTLRRTCWLIEPRHGALALTGRAIAAEINGADKVPALGSAGDDAKSERFAETLSTLQDDIRHDNAEIQNAMALKEFGRAQAALDDLRAKQKMWFGVFHP